MRAKTGAIAGLGFILLLGACSDEPVDPEVQMSPDSTTVTDEESQDGEENETETEDPENEPQENETPDEESPDGEEVEASGPSAFFMADGTVKHFHGEGNEFANLTVETEHLDARHVALYEDNGGTRMLRIFRISDDRIDLVLEQPEFYEMYESDPAMLDVIGTYLMYPPEAGQIVLKGEVISVDETVHTPLQTFEQAIVIESAEEGGAKNRLYLVEGFGEVMREYIMNEEGAEFIVSSSLKALEP